MKKKLTLLPIVLFFLFPHHSKAATLQGISFFSPRSQSVNAARELVGWHPLINRYDMDRCYAAFAATPTYGQSLRANRINQALFGTDELTISGSLVQNRTADELLADYFGLSPLFMSKIKLEPLIRNFIFDMNLFVGLDAWKPGLYFTIHAPAGWTRWNFNLVETPLNQSTSPFPAGYMATEEVTPIANSFKEAITGNKSFGQIEALKFGKIDGPKSKGGLSDLQFALGYNFILKEDAHLGFNIRATAPTGNTPNSEFFFEPLLGNANRWELGIGCNGHTVIWEKDGYQDLSLYGVLNITHIFGAKQKRSFDFCNNGFLSRYILLKEFDSSHNFLSKVTPAINQTTLDCTVSNDIQVDLVVMFSYNHKDTIFDIGYNGWIRSKEKISLRECIPANKYGLKGIQDVYDTNINMSDALTQNTATIFGNNLTNQDMVADNPSPQFISTQDLNMRSAASPMLLTHKIFFNIQHNWERWNGKPKFSPFIGIGSEIEFEGINERNTAQADKTTMGQWNLWLKGGFVY